MFLLFLDVVILTLFFADPVFAHDCWLQPDKFYLGLEAFLFARLFVGHKMAPEKELPLEKNMTPRLDLIRKDGKIDLLDQLTDGCQPAVAFDPGAEGSGLIVMDRDFTMITLDNEKFGTYLSHEKHEQLLPAMKANPRGEQVERYARCMKALVQVGDRIDDKIPNKRTDQKLEIILHTHPRLCTGNSVLEASVFFDGNPLADKYVTACQLRPDGKVFEQTACTDANGNASFTVEGPGVWLLRLIHLSPYTGSQDIDWESYWASFCFDLN
ncbi:MAG: DUF4198 domain-containing protein [Thermodesulfobacteriota bacterium]